MLAILLLWCCQCADIDTVHDTVYTESKAEYRKTGPDIVLIVLDTLRPDHLSQYGYALDTSPGLASFAKVATQFNNAWAPSPWTLPSTTSILTGLHPLQHGMRHPGDILPPAMDTLAERLREEGWRTAGFSHNVSVSPRHGMNQGFDSFVINTGKVLAYPHARRMINLAEEWVGQNQEGPAFLYLQPMNCHGPYKVPTSKATALLGRTPSRQFRYYEGPMRSVMSEGKAAARKNVKPNYIKSAIEQYDTSIRYETDEVAGFLRELKSANRYDNAMIILTADHGEEFFEHGGFSHGYSLHTEVLAVPLMIKYPGQTKASVVEAPVSLLDIYPTVLETLGIAVPASVEGRSLLTLSRGEERKEQPFVFDVDWSKRIVGRALLDKGWKYIEIGHNYEGLRDETRLYHLKSDRGENKSLAQKHVDRVTSMAETLAREVKRLDVGIEPASRISKEDREQLEALGYLE